KGAESLGFRGQLTLDFPAHSLYVFILSFHWHKLINDVILQRITYNNYLVEIGRYRWLHYQGFACVACRDYHLIPLI
ncbi:hypothetical protein, partial [Bacteroides uniformis]|uniref:hypothetical protein n=1 Tax=Bacteroides uniformis TaxID=820 RepID=UPI001C70014C